MVIAHRTEATMRIYLEVVATIAGLLGAYIVLANLVV
jgi:hypothetical protein